MCEPKKEFACHKPCCAWLNEAATSFYEDASVLLTKGVQEVAATFASKITLAQADAINSIGNLPNVVLVGGVPPNGLTAAQANALNIFVSTLAPGATFTAFVVNGAFSAAQLAALNTILGYIPNPAANVPLTAADVEAIATALDAIAVGAGSRFKDLQNKTSEQQVRIHAFRHVFNRLNCYFLDKLRDYAEDDCDKSCCKSAADTLRAIAISFLAHARGILTTLPALPEPAINTVPAPGTLQHSLMHILKEARVAFDSIKVVSGCDSSSSSCEKKCHRRRECREEEDSCVGSSSTFEDRRREEERKCREDERKCREEDRRRECREKRFESCEECPRVSTWKGGEVKW